MIDVILALVPVYGVYLIFAVVFLATLAIPLPASLVLLTSGGFTAAGDLTIPSVIIAVSLAYVLGDQLAYALARRFGPRLLTGWESSKRVSPLLEKSRSLLHRRGALAVLLSHTLLSPTGPYVSYLSGAGGLRWRTFTCAAVPGALIWSLCYLGLGYAFTAHLEVVAAFLNNFFGVVLAGGSAFGLLILIRHRWTAYKRANYNA